VNYHNPNYIAPTPPPGDNSDRIATTAFVAGGSGGSPTGVVNVAAFGAVGDGVTDDAPAINNASAFAVANGITKIIFVAGKTYRITNAQIEPRHDLVWDGQGCTIISNGHYPVLPNGIISNSQSTYANKVLIGDVTSDITGPTDQLTLTSVAGLAVGNWVGFRLGVSPSDNTEPYYAQAARVKAIVGTTITIDHLIPYSIHIGAYTYFPKVPGAAGIAVPAAPAGDKKSVFRLDTPCCNLEFRNFNLVGDGDVESGFSLLFAVNVIFDNIRGNPNPFIPPIPYGAGVTSGEMGAGLFTFGYSRNIQIRNGYLGCNTNVTGQGSKGRYIGFAGCQNCVDENHVTKDIKNVVVALENCGDNIRIVNPTDYFDSATMTSPFYAYFIGPRNTCSIVNPTVYSNTSFQSYWEGGGGDGDVHFQGLFIWRGPLAQAIAVVYPDRFDCVFDYDNPTDGWAKIDFTSREATNIKWPMIPGNSAAYLLPGSMIAADLYLSAGAAPPSSIFLPGTSDVHTVLVAGSVVAYNGPYPTIGAGQGGINYWVKQQQVSIFNGATAQPANAFIGISIRTAKVLGTNVSGAAYGNNVSYALTDDNMSLQLSGQLAQPGVNAIAVASLPAATSINVGFRFMVNNANSTTFGSIVAGPGANIVPVYSDGTNWRIG
jgi:hypothetical protein